MADNEQEKSKWVIALNELHRILRKSKLPDKKVLVAKEVLDASVPLMKQALCAIIIDRDRIVIGGDEGLVTYDLDREEVHKVAGENKRIEMIRFVPEEQLLVIVAGKKFI